MTSQHPARTRPVRRHDLVLFGATGFTGRLVAEYLAARAPQRTRIALAGRNTDKLEDLRRRIGGRVHSWPVIAADASDDAALGRMAAQTRAIVTTVGPYAKYGRPVIAACAENGTHYADLCGEPLFMRQMIDEFHERAAASGARIVHSCGFDSIPSDLGVLALHLAAKADDGVGHLAATEIVFTSLRGSVSGGTIASFLYEQERLAERPQDRALAADPYILSPDRTAEPKPGDPPPSRSPRYNDELDLWTAPFLMEFINAPNVRRSNALAGYPYGQGFRYRECMATGSGLAGRAAATAVATGLAAANLFMAYDETRRLAERALGRSGTGPGEETRRKGHFRLIGLTRTRAGVKLRARVEAKGDPGYLATSMMLGQAGLTLAGDQRLLPRRKGVLTPATAMGSTLITNLKAAGMTITAERV